MGMTESRQQESREVRLKRLRYRASHRGFKEADLVIGGFADHHLDTLDTAQLDRFEALLAVPDQDLYGWIVGRAAPPAEHDHDVLGLLRRFDFKSGALR
jgi:antitoxin CptB